MPERSEIIFLLNGRRVTLAQVAASDTLLDFLRLDQRLTGTKEGCAEGDCGACTVLVGRLSEAGLIYEPVNACIRFLASVQGCHVVTVEHLRGTDGNLHPVQQALVDRHASQCGFCTPGFVMSLYALWMQTPSPSQRQIEVALQGNLCRCTGYEPIVKAAMAMAEYGSPEMDLLNTERAAVTAQLETMQTTGRIVSGPDTNQSILPLDVDDLAAVLIEHPCATIVAGATDVGLWVTKFLRPIGPAVFIGHLNDLKQITPKEDRIVIGAGASYSETQDSLAYHFPTLGPYWDRVAGWQVRNMGTVGGNIANGSPIGDTPPVLMALGATIVLRRGSSRRRLLLQDFFIDYGKQDLAEGEFIEAIEVPLLDPQTHFAAYKISKRRDEDISSVAAGISVTVDGGLIENACIAYGGMAATPKRATAAETALIGQPWTGAAFDAAAQALRSDFTPLTDMRATAEYRMLAAQNVLRRFWLEKGAPSDVPIHLVAE